LIFEESSVQNFGRSIFVEWLLIRLYLSRINDLRRNISSSEMRVRVIKHSIEFMKQHLMTVHSRPTINCCLVDRESASLHFQCDHLRLWIMNVRSYHPKVSSISDRLMAI
jgi:hypothetical protein